MKVFWLDIFYYDAATAHTRPFPFLIEIATSLLKAFLLLDVAYSLQFQVTMRRGIKYSSHRVPIPGFCVLISWAAAAGLCCHASASVRIPDHLRFRLNHARPESRLMKKGRPACPVFPVRGNRIHPSRRNRKAANFAVGSEFTQHTPASEPTCRAYENGKTLAKPLWSAGLFQSPLNHPS